MINSCTSNRVTNSEEFTLKGKITGQDSGLIILSYFHDERSVYDTSIIANGKFTFKGEIFEPGLALLSDRNDLNRVFIYLEPQKMKISLSNDNFREFKMTGSKTQNESDLLNKMEEPYYKKIMILRDQYNKITDSIKGLKDDSTKLLLLVKGEEVKDLWSLAAKKIDSIRIKFIIENSKSFLALYSLRTMGSTEAIPPDSTKSIFDGLDLSLRESRYGKLFYEDIRKRMNVSLGAQAPDFKAIDMEQQIVTLSQFKGKSVVLLDFWASWCVPCRESIPHLKTIYNKHHSRGFDIIAVSTDENRESWIEAIGQEGMEMWYHILIGEKWPDGLITNDDIFQDYFITAIPEIFLIDINGKIIYRHVGYSKESEESLDRLLFQIFEN
jgi:peroxiredoxin